MDKTPEEFQQVMIDWEVAMFNRMYFLRTLTKEADDLSDKVKKQQEEIRRLEIFNRMLLGGDMQKGGAE